MHIHCISKSHVDVKLYTTFFYYYYFYFIKPLAEAMIPIPSIYISPYIATSV